MAEHTPVDLGALRAELHRQGAPWRSVDTTIAMLEEDDRLRLLGVPLPEQEEIDRIHEQSAALAEIQPTTSIGGNGAQAGIGATFDARDVGGNNYVTSIKNQGNCGACVAFGACATLETTAAFQRAQPGLKLDLSEQHLFFVLGASSGASCTKGWRPELAFAACRDTGVTFEDYMPYQPGGGGTLNPDWPNRLAKITGFQTLTGDIAVMKRHILAHGAISACMFVYQDFYSYGGGVYKHITGVRTGGHCISIVGFDDGLGCWIVKNSWGSGWGEHGFCRIAYGQCGIESWGVHGADYVNLRMWVDATIRGLWSNEAPDNAWAYLSNLGWARLANAVPNANLLMLTELTSARLRNKQIHAFHDNGQIDETYVF